MKTLLHDAVVVTCDPNHTVLDPGDVIVEDDRISFVGTSYEGPYDARLNLTGRLLMPGLINAHTHSGMSIFRGLADDVDLMVFLQERVWPRELQLTPDDVYAGALLSAVEMLKSGVTTYVDMYFFEEELTRAALESGARALITATILSAPVWEPRLGTWEQQLARAVRFCTKHEGRDGRIHTGIGPHAPYTVPMEALDEIAAEGRRLGLPVNIHLVETQQERDAFNAHHGVSTATALRDRGFFEGDVIAAHSVWLDQGDAQTYATANVGVAHCPQSNAKLGAGIAPLAELLDHGVQVGLGTDSATTNNNLNLWEEIRLAPLLAKVVAGDPKPVPADQALWMATGMGARATFQPQIGAVQEGLQADLIALRLDDTSTVPIFGPHSYIDHLVYSMGRELVDSVWVAGRRVVKDGQILTVDESEVRRRAQAVAFAVSQRMEA